MKMVSSLIRYLPKTGGDICAFIFLLFSIHSIGIFELFIVLPSIYLSDAHATPTGGFSLYYFHVFMGIYIYLNVMINMYLIMTTNTSIRGKMLPSILRPGWRFCAVCESNSPPRSFHCFTCKTCILKRDHHCTFTGNCIGLYNHRYYVSLIFYMCVACAYSCVLNFDFVYHLFGTLSLKSVLTIMFPMISWIFYSGDSMTNVQVFMTSLCLVGFFLSGGLFTYHIINAFNGQIVHEKTYNINTYNLGWKQNIALLLGKRWKIAWLCSLIGSQIPSDGLEYVTREQYESLKTM